MFHKIKTVVPTQSEKLIVTFQNGIEKIYDIKILYDVFPQFKIFEKDKCLFNNVKVDVGGYGISWNDELDLDAEEIWENGTETGIKENLDVFSMLAENLTKAREIKGITQKELAETTGIYQADISKIERAKANPSVKLLERLAEGMNMEIKIEFVSKNSFYEDTM